MNKLVYTDDRQITYSEIIQVGIDVPIKMAGVENPPGCLRDRRTNSCTSDSKSAPDFIQLPQ